MTDRVRLSPEERAELCVGGYVAVYPKAYPAAERRPHRQAGRTGSTSDLRFAEVGMVGRTK